jgi:type I restriction enzyme S subunit
VRGPGVVTGRYGTLGDVYYIASDFWPLNTALYVRDFKGNEPRFIAALLESLNLGRSETAAAVPGVNRNHLHMLPVRCPDVATQRAIGHLVASLDDLIEKRTRQMTVLEEIARTIFHEWFVELHYPGHSGTSLVPSALGPIPREWTVCRLSDVSRLVRGRSYRRAELVDQGGVPFVNLKCLRRGGGFRTEGLKRYAGTFSDEQRVQSGDLVLGVTDLTQERAILARATFVPELGEVFGVISLDVIRLVPNEPLDRVPLFYLLSCTDFADRVKGYANGATVLHLAPGHLADALILWPSAGLREHFAELVGPLTSNVATLRQTADKLASVRDLLLPRLVTGQLDISGIELSEAV